MSDPAELADALRGALTPRTNLIHPTYRHLSRALTIAGLNVAQWVIVVVGLAVTWVTSTVLPLSAEWSFSIAGTIAGVPTAILFVLAAEGDFDARPVVRGVWSWRCSARVLLPVAGGRQPVGYRLTSAVKPVATRRASAAAPTDLSLDALWRAAEPPTPR
jgi:hypothetical protein